MQVQTDLYVCWGEGVRGSDEGGRGEVYPTKDNFLNFFQQFTIISITNYFIHIAKY